MKKEKLAKGLIMAGLLMGIIISAMDNTIVSTALGTIVSELGGMDKFVWVSSAYLIASVAGMLIYGKLSDMYGRKSYFIFGVALFMAGSALCGLSRDITQLSLFRAVQGLGGGAVMPVAFTIVFDTVPMEQRGKIAGLFRAAFGISSIFGPLLGAYLTDCLNWRWIFYVNIPIGILSVLMLAFNYKESAVRIRQRIDWPGAALLVLSVTSLLIALELGGKTYLWSSAQIIGLFGMFAVLMALFMLVERRAREPIVSFELFRSRLFASSQAVSFFYGTVYILATIYIPIYIQGVFGGTAINAGLVILPMTVGSVLGSQLGGIATSKASYRKIMLCSCALFITGIALMGTLSTNTPRWAVTLYMIITGLGAGMNFSVLTISSVDGVSAAQRGSANSSLAFFRSVGMTIGITIFGVIQNHIMQNGFLKSIPGFGTYGKSVDARALLQHEVRIHIPTAVLEKMTRILAGSIAQIFLWSLISLTIALVFIIIMGNRRLNKIQSVGKTEF